MKRALAKVMPGAVSPVCCALLMALLLAACGGGGSGLGPGLTAAGPAPPAGQKAVPPLFGNAGLPSVGSLSEAGGRSVSISGPGYQKIRPQQFVRALNFASVPDGKLESNGLTPFAWAAYAMHNFPEDSFPTDLKVTTDTSGAEYWVACADFELGQWTFAGPFNASAQVQLPFAGKPGGLHDYVSDSGQALVMIAVPVGNDVVLAGLELGVDGGDSAPSPPEAFMPHPGPAGILLAWRHSRSFNDADFAGYLIERAPLLSGDFAALNATPTKDTDYYDASCLPEFAYRYRVASVDTSGNRAYAPPVNSETDPLGDTAPFLTVNFNPGPFQGVSAVSFDFNGSFDPDGEVITEYKAAELGGTVLVSGPDPVQTAQLQPGCYIFRLSVTANGVTTTGDYQVKVFPRWSSSPLTVAAPLAGAGARLYQGRMRYLADGTTLALVGHDSVSDALVVWTGVPGDMLTPHRLWSIYAPDYIEEPIMYQGNLIIPLITGANLLVLSWNEDEAGSNGFAPVGAAASGISKCSIVNDGTTCYAVAAASNGGTYDLTVTPLFDAPPDEQRPVTGLAAIEAVAAAYNAGANAIDIIYAEGSKVKWLRWSLASQSIVDSEDLAAFSSSCIDVEINPASGEPAVCYLFTDRTRYREFDGANWSGEELVDNSVANFAPFDLRFAHGTRYLYSAVDSGFSALYEYDAGALLWTRRNTPPELSAGGKDATIVQGSAPGEMLALDRDSGNEVRLLSLLPGDSSTVLKTFDSLTGQGLQLRGAPGSDGLHIACLDATGKPFHFVGDNNGSGWTSTSMPWAYVTSLDIGSQSDGEVYLSLNNADLSGDYQLEYWDPVGGAFVNEIAPIPGIPDNHPFLGWSRLSNQVGWSYFDAVAGKLFLLRTNQTTGLVTSDDTIGPEIVWRGAMAAPQPNTFCLFYSGMDPWDGAVSLHARGKAEVETQYDILLGGNPPLDLMTGVQTTGRTMDGATYLKLYNLSLFGNILPSEYYVMAQGPLFNLASIDIDLLEQKTIVFEGDENPYSALFTKDLRRTVSVADAGGATAVSLIANLGGAAGILRWSNYGEWEDLPLPPGTGRMNRPELLVGLDGRWHIVYQDWTTNELKCLSTE